MAFSELFDVAQVEEGPTEAVVRSLRLADGVCYNAERARDTHAKIAQVEPGELSKPVRIEVPYTGIGNPPARPGGDLVMVGRQSVEVLTRLFRELWALKKQGCRIYVTGPVGSGKTSLLREFAVSVLKQAIGSLTRIVCVWNLHEGREDFAEVMKLAFLFTYAAELDTVDRIQKVTSEVELHAFMDERSTLLGESFVFIIDGGEVLESTMSARESLEKFFKKAQVTIICLSPRPSRKRKAGADWYHIISGFSKPELRGYLELSLLSRVCEITDCAKRLNDILYFAGTHPLSLAVLDDCCRLLARKRHDFFKHSDKFLVFDDIEDLSEEQVLRELQDPEDWDELLDMFVASEELATVRTLAASALSKVKLKEVCYSARSMMELDRRFIYGDLDLFEATPRFVNPYIERIYTEEMRKAEAEAVVEGSAWEPYCRYLLDTAGANWAQMGWICGNFVGEIISLKGMWFQEVQLPKCRVERFGAVPGYGKWIAELKKGSAVLFLPLRYNYGSIDGVLIVVKGDGKLLFIAIQVTVNDKDHQASAPAFMNWATVSKWIPEQHRSNWELHYVFLCLRDLPAREVAEDLTLLTGDSYSGTVGYWLHTVNITTAFHGLVSESVEETLKRVVEKRDEVKRPSHPVHAVPTDELPAEVACEVKKLMRDKMTKTELREVAKSLGVTVLLRDAIPILRKKIIDQLIYLEG